jgi:CheY-like chemotaxis protein
MSLVGNLEDLGFGDILQIVSLSRKSGALLIHRGADKAKIIFGNGQVLAAFTGAGRQDLCASLLGRGIVGPGLVAQARARHRDSGGRASIAECLVAAGAPAGSVQEAARAEIERVVLGLFHWVEGDFSFEHRDVEQDLARVRAHPQRVVCESGINPQFLAIEASRLADESRRGPDPAGGGRPSPDEAGGETGVQAGPDEGAGSSGFEWPGASAAEAAVGAAVEGAPCPEVPRRRRGPTPVSRIVLVDDDERFIALLVPVLEAWGFAAEAFPGGGPAAERIEALARSGELFAVVSDLLMPRVDGGGLLGGLELLERVRDRFATLPFVLITDHLHEEAEARARALDVDFTVAKPRSAQLSGGAGSPAFQEFAGVLGPILRSFAPPAETAAPPPAAAADAPRETPDAHAPPEGWADSVIDIGFAIRQAAGPDALSEPYAPTRTAASALETLKSMLCELSNPGASDEVTLLVLRFAAEVMNRGVLFMVKDGEAIGLGGFGLDIGPGAAGAPRPAFTRGSALRRIRIPLDAPSVLRDVIAKRSVLRGPLEASAGNALLLDALGGAEPGDGFAAPVCVGEKVIAVLYGDNVPESRPVIETEALEIFLTQAGLALEKAMLERRLRELRGRA